MGQELGLDGPAGVFPLSDRFAELGGIPVDDDGGEQVEPGHAVVLALAGIEVFGAHAQLRGNEAKDVQGNGLPPLEG